CNCIHAGTPASCFPTGRNSTSELRGCWRCTPLNCLLLAAIVTKDMPTAPEGIGSAAMRSTSSCRSTLAGVLVAAVPAPQDKNKVLSGVRPFTLVLGTG